MRSALFLVALLVAACADEPDGAGDAPAAQERAAAPRKPKAGRRRGGEAATPEPPAPQPPRERAPPSTVPLTAESFPRLVREKGSGLETPTLTADSLRADEALRAQAVRLLVTTDDQLVMTGLRHLFYEGALRDHEGEVFDDLVAALASDDDSTRRIAALSGLGIERAAPTGTVRAAVLARLRTEDSPEVVQLVAASLRRGLMTADERTALLACVALLDVPAAPATSVRHPARLARRMVYEEIAADAVRRDEWEPVLARLAAAPSDNERQDIAAGIAVMGDFTKAPPLPPEGTPERATLLAQRQRALGEVYRATADLACRRRLVESARKGLGALPAAAATSDDDRRAAAAFLDGLIAFETDDTTLAVLRRTRAEVVAPAR